MKNRKCCSMHARPAVGSVTLYWHTIRAVKAVYFLFSLFPNQSHKLKKFSCSLTSKTMYKHSFSSGYCRMHWLVLALALSPLSQTFRFASLHSWKESYGFKRFHSGTRFQKFAVSEAPAHRCHVKGRPNRDKSVLFEAKTQKMVLRSVIVISWCCFQWSARKILIRAPRDITVPTPTVISQAGSCYDRLCVRMLKIKTWFLLSSQNGC